MRERRTFEFVCSVVGLGGVDGGRAGSGRAGHLPSPASPSFSSHLALARPAASPPAAPPGRTRSHSPSFTACLYRGPGHHSHPQPPVCNCFTLCPTTPRHGGRAVTAAPARPAPQPRHTAQTGSSTALHTSAAPTQGGEVVTALTLLRASSLTNLK